MTPCVWRQSLRLFRQGKCDLRGHHLPFPEGNNQSKTQKKGACMSYSTARPCCTLLQGHSDCTILNHRRTGRIDWDITSEHRTLSRKRQSGSSRPQYEDREHRTGFAATLPCDRITDASFPKTVIFIHCTYNLVNMSVTTIDAILSPVLLKTSPWSLFNQAWTAIMGYSADDFRFIQEKTPMSTFKETGTMIAFYYLTIFTGYRWMKNREPFKLSTLFKIHNLMLTAVSGALLVLFLEQLVPSLWNNGLYKCICSSPGWTDKLVVLYYLNYLIKYVELLDTVFLVLKKKPLTFLHTYHHGATAFLCWTQLVGRTPVSWVPITLNLTVHVVMYWYYFQSARGIRVGWKEWITRLQIIQFVLDLGFVYFATWDFYADEWGLDGLHLGRCEGELVAAVTGCLTLSSYLLLFISFYIATYRKPSTRGRKAVSTKKDQAVTATGRAAETLKSARSRFGTASMDSVESSKNQWAVSRD